MILIISCRQLLLILLILTYTFAYRSIIKNKIYLSKLKACIQLNNNNPNNQVDSINTKSNLQSLSKKFLASNMIIFSLFQGPIISNSNADTTSTSSISTNSLENSIIQLETSRFI